MFSIQREKKVAKLHAGYSNDSSHAKWLDCNINDEINPTKVILQTTAK